MNGKGMDLHNFSKKIIAGNQYLTIASSDEHGNPWASTVAYCIDEEYTFYWASVPGSRHQKNIKLNPKIVFTIFDSHQQWGKGEGLQIEARVEEVALKDMLVVSKKYFGRQYPYGGALTTFGKGLRKLLTGKIYRFYKAVPTKVWTSDPNAKVDARMEVVLK